MPTDFFWVVCYLLLMNHFWSIHGQSKSYIAAGKNDPRPLFVS